MQFAYELIHSYLVEIDKETGEEARSTNLLGFFETEEKCKEHIPFYVTLEGFCNYPDDFFIEKVTADINDYNDEPGEFDSVVYSLEHEWYDGEYDHCTYLGYYSSREHAEEALLLYQLEPRFRGHLDDFMIYESPIGERGYTCGFFQYHPSSSKEDEAQASLRGSSQKEFCKQDFTYKLQHEYAQTHSDEHGATVEEANKVNILGFFRTKKECSDLISQYAKQKGFLKFPDGFNTIKVQANIDDFNNDLGAFESSIFYLKHIRYDDYMNEVAEPLGYYSSRELAEEALIQYRHKSKFRGYLDDFSIEEYAIGKAERTEGFYIPGEADSDKKLYREVVQPED